MGSDRQFDSFNPIPIVIHVVHCKSLLCNVLQATLIDFPSLNSYFLCCRLIVDKIDEDKDGFVSQEELKDWIRYTQRRYITDDVDRHWKTHNPEDKEKISWEEYKKMLYGFMDGEWNQSGDDNVFKFEQILNMGTICEICMKGYTSKNLEVV